MIAVDTNVLVYAHREESPHHAKARGALHALVDAGRAWAVPWPCVHEFLAVVTHPRIYSPPTPVDVAAVAVTELLSRSGAVLLGEAPDHLSRLSALLAESGAAGPRVHDARIAAICLSHGVTELWTVDRDFSYFPALRTRNPLVA